MPVKKKTPNRIVADCRRLARKLYGAANIHPEQKRSLFGLAKGKDVLAVLPTGHGKSLIFQTYAKAKNTTVIVITPLKALMRDQVMRAKQKGFKAAYIASGDSESDSAMDDLEEGALDLLYVSPERLRGSPFLRAVKKADIGLIAVDECHPPGTLIRTREGDVPIENLKAGDSVISIRSDGRIRENIIRKVSKKKNRKVLKLVTHYGILCVTANHPVYVDGIGYIPAESVRPGDFLLQIPNDLEVSGLQVEFCCPRKTSEKSEILLLEVHGQIYARKELEGQQHRVRPLWEAIPTENKKDIGGPLLFAQVLDRLSRNERDKSYREEEMLELPKNVQEPSSGVSNMLLENVCSTESRRFFIGTDDAQKSNAAARCAAKSIERDETAGRSIYGRNPRRQRKDSTYPEAGCVMVSDDEARVSHRDFSRKGSPLSKVRFGSCSCESGGRVGRTISPQPGRESTRRGTGFAVEVTRVDCVENKEQDGTEKPRGSSSDDITVYSLEIANDHNYLAGGFLVHNCHCLVEWGDRFRPAYKYIGNFIDALARARRFRAPVLALTATATVEDRKQIANLLHLRPKFRTVIGDPVRSNLDFRVIHGNPWQEIKKVFGVWRAANFPGRYIIYCSSKKATEDVAATLNQFGVFCRAYHAGMDEKTRKTIETAYAENRYKVIVATNAFGMGIDHPDIREVAHFGPPKSMEAFSQESGRAGRDGKPAMGTMIFDQKGLGFQRRLVTTAVPEDHILESIWEHVSEGVEEEDDEIETSVHDIYEKLKPESPSLTPYDIEPCLLTLDAMGALMYRRAESSANLNFDVADLQSGLSKLDGNVKKVAKAVLASVGGQGGGVSIYYDVDKLSDTTGLTTGFVRRAISNLDGHHNLLTVQKVYNRILLSIKKLGLPATEVIDYDAKEAYGKRLMGRLESVVEFAHAKDHKAFIRKYFGYAE